jgi:uncharacterized protein (TIGR02421 family)
VSDVRAIFWVLEAPRLSVVAHPFGELDRELVRVAKDVKVLSAISWPGELAERFLASWRAGRPELPQPPPPEVDFDPAALEALERLASAAGDHPIARFIARTADSYLRAARMLQAAGTPDFGKRSVALYGRPTDPVAAGGATNLTAADHFIEATAELAKSDYLPPEANAYKAKELRDLLQERIAPFFTRDKVEVVLDPTLTSKAAAGAFCVRIRPDARFNRHDLEQLYHHEALVHTATLLNGRHQPALAALSLGAPRTTATQEGLATFAELITGAIDLGRLRRLALRVKAVQMGLDGADFIEVFRFFRQSGQSERESYFSTARIFRGGDVRGGAVFTKDGVYLRGLLNVHTFFHAALAGRKVQFPHYLFAGRLTCGDVVDLEECFAEGLVAPPVYEPDWVKNRSRLAAYLAFSALSHTLPIEEARTEHFAHLSRRTERYGFRVRGLAESGEEE